MQERTKYFTTCRLSRLCVIARMAVDRHRGVILSLTSTEPIG
jgi:hypothetical protein